MLGFGENSFLISLSTLWINATHPFYWERCEYFGHQVLFAFVNAAHLSAYRTFGMSFSEKAAKVRIIAGFIYASIFLSAFYIY